MTRKCWFLKIASTILSRFHPPVGGLWRRSCGGLDAPARLQAGGALVQVFDRRFSRWKEIPARKHCLYCRNQISRRITFADRAANSVFLKMVNDVLGQV